MSGPRRNDSHDIADLLGQIAALPATGYRAEAELIAVIEKTGRRILSDDSLRTPAITARLKEIVARSPGGDIRKAALDVIVRMAGTDTALAVDVSNDLAGIAQDVNDELCDDACDILETLAEQSPGAATAAMRALIKLLDDPQGGALREKAAASLGKIGALYLKLADDVSDALLRGTAAGDEDVAEAALSALGKVGVAHQSAAVRVADRLLQEMEARPKDATAKAALIALSKLGIPEEDMALRAVAALKNFLLEPKSRNKHRALEFLSGIAAAWPDTAAAQAVGAMTATWPGANERLRGEIAESFKKAAIGNEKAASEAALFLRGVFRDAAEDKFLRGDVAAVLAQLAIAHEDLAGDITETLAAGLADQEYAVSSAAIEALGEISAYAPTLWTNSLRDRFRQAAQKANVSQEVRDDAEQVTDEAAQNSSWREQHSRLLRQARRLGL